MAVIQIDVISDFVCVWCYIGKKQLEAAIALYQKVYPGGKDDVFSITYRPYFLDYNASPRSIDKSILMAKKFAETSEEKKAALHRRISQIGQSLGINFKWGGKIGWTREAHRLVYLSRSQPAEVQDKLLEGIFSAYHEQEKDIASVDTLRQIAVDAGIDDEEVDGWLTSNEGLDEMLAEVQEFRTIREKTGVPAYRIQNAYMLEGSQDLQDWMEIFIKIRENEPSQS